MLNFEEVKISTSDEAIPPKTLDTTIFQYVNKQTKSLLTESLKCDSLAHDRVEYIKSANSVLSTANSLYDNLKKMIAANLDIQESDAIDVFHQVDASLTYKNEVISICFNRLPPKRSKSIIDNTHAITREFSAAVFRAFAKYKESSSTNILRIRNEKALVSYVFHYLSPSDLLDYDNYDMKIITDNIKSLFLEDDSPYYINQFFTSQKDEKAFLEVRIEVQ